MRSLVMHLFVVIATVAATVTALPAWHDQEVDRFLAKLYASLDQPDFDKHDENGHKTRNLDKLGGGNIVREIRNTEPAVHPLFGNKRLIDSLSGVSFGTEKRGEPEFEGQCVRHFFRSAPLKGKRNFDEIDRASFNSFAKRNFDEIDRAGFNNFFKRNFDEIDRAGFNSFFKRNFDEIDRAGFNNFFKRNFDEIDRAGFNSFFKRNFDEIDRAGFNNFFKRNFDEIDRAGFNGFVKRNFDEIDRSSFNGFDKRFDEIDRSGFNGFNKRNFDEIDLTNPRFFKRSPKHVA